MHAATNYNRQSSEDRFQNPSRSSPLNVSVHDIQPSLLSSHKSSDASISPSYGRIDESKSDTAHHASIYQRDDNHEQTFEPNTNVNDSNVPAFDATGEWNTRPQDFRGRHEYTQHDFHPKTNSASLVNSYNIHTQDTPTSPVCSYQERRKWPLDGTDEFHLLQHYVDSLAPWVRIWERDPRARVLIGDSV